MSAELYNAAALRDAAEPLLDLLGDFGIDEETVAISHADKALRESMKTERTLAVLRNRSMEYLDDRMLRMADWKYPLTNVSRFAQNQRSRETTIVRDADGNVICTFAGLPYRRKKAAVAMASEFVAHMNAKHAALNEATEAMGKVFAGPLQCVCGGIGAPERRITPSGSPMIMPLYEMRIRCLRCGMATNWHDDGAKAEDEWKLRNLIRW